MRSSQIRILFVSLLAVFAVGAVTSGSASAAGQCYKVIEAKTGRFENWPRCWDGESVIKEGEWINTAKLEKELGSPSEWCAKVETAKTGNYEDNACTKKAAEKEFIKVHVPTFWVCKEGGTEKYEEHLCTKKSETGKWSYLGLKEGEAALPFEGTSGVSKLESTLGGLRAIIECKKDKITGELESGGRTKNVVITYEECKLFTVSKYVKTEQPKCIVANITTEKLNDYLIMGKGIGPEDEFEPATGTTFAKIKITGAECSFAPAEEVVTGKQICQLPEATVGKVEHEIECSPSGGSLKFGAAAVPASYYGTANVKLTNGWSWGAEP